MRDAKIQKKYCIMTTIHIFICKGRAAKLDIATSARDCLIGSSDGAIFEHSLVLLVNLRHALSDEREFDIVINKLQCVGTADIIIADLGSLDDLDRVKLCPVLSTHLIVYITRDDA